ncbi:MAG: signal peptidase I [Treponema sp.]|nr:signal peptidase I [Treponema sp.]
MFDKWKQYSYTAQKKQRHKILKYILAFFIIYIIYNLLTAFFFSVWVVDNNTMQPQLNKGDHLIFTSFVPPWNNKNDINSLPFKRGSIVLVDMRHYKDKKLPLRILDGFVRFFTFQKVTIFSGEGQYYIKRVIALPGDEVSMSNYVFKVKAAGSQHEYTEFEHFALEHSTKTYHPAIPQVSELWDNSIPFSGSMDRIILGPNECFVISDDRSNTNDSRTWGVVSTSLISARALVRIWPFNKIGSF